MNPFELDIDLVAGDDETIEFVFEESDGTPLDLTGRTFWMEVRKTPQSTGAADCTFTCTVPPPEQDGVVIAEALAAETLGLSPGKAYWWSLLQTTGAAPDGETLVWGRVDVIPKVTKVGT